jgi:hypothetical protein
VEVAWEGEAEAEALVLLVLPRPVEVDVAAEAKQVRTVPVVVGEGKVEAEAKAVLEYSDVAEYGMSNPRIPHKRQTLSLLVSANSEGNLGVRSGDLVAPAGPLQP